MLQKLYIMQLQQTKLESTAWLKLIHIIMHGKIIDKGANNSHLVNVDGIILNIHVKSHHYDLRFISKLRL